jgi:putative transposase
LTAIHVRYKYRRLTASFRREGWNVSAKGVYRLHEKEDLKVRSPWSGKDNRRQRMAQSPASGSNQCWSADFVCDKLADGRFYRILSVDQFTRAHIALEAYR